MASTHTTTGQVHRAEPTDYTSAAVAYEAMRAAGWTITPERRWTHPGLTRDDAPGLTVTDAEWTIHQQLGEPREWPPEPDTPRRPVRHLLACVQGPIACVCPLQSNEEPF